MQRMTPDALLKRNFSHNGQNSSKARGLVRTESARSDGGKGSVFGCDKPPPAQAGQASVKSPLNLQTEKLSFHDYPDGQTDNSSTSPPLANSAGVRTVASCAGGTSSGLTTSSEVSQITQGIGGSEGEADGGASVPLGSRSTGDSQDASYRSFSGRSDDQQNHLENISPSASISGQSHRNAPHPAPSPQHGTNRAANSYQNRPAPSPSPRGQPSPRDNPSKTSSPRPMPGGNRYSSRQQTPSSMKSTSPRSLPQSFNNGYGGQTSMPRPPSLQKMAIISSNLQAYMPYSLTEEELMELTHIISIQESKYNTNMFEAMKPEDYSELGRLQNMGYKYEDAVLLIFERNYKPPNEPATPIPLFRMQHAQMQNMMMQSFQQSVFSNAPVYPAGTMPMYYSGPSGMSYGMMPVSMSPYAGMSGHPQAQANYAYAFPMVSQTISVFLRLLSCLIISFWMKAYGRGWTSTWCCSSSSQNAAGVQ